MLDYVDEIFEVANTTSQFYAGLHVVGIDPGKKTPEELADLREAFVEIKRRWAEEGMDIEDALMLMPECR